MSDHRLVIDEMGRAVITLSMCHRGCLHVLGHASSVMSEFGGGTTDEFRSSREPPINVRLSSPVMLSEGKQLSSSTVCSSCRLYYQNPTNQQVCRDLK